MISIQSASHWLWRYSGDGIERRLGLESFDKIPLTRARVKAEALQDQLDRGIDPKTAKEEQKAERRRAYQPKIGCKTFRQCSLRNTSQAPPPVKESMRLFEQRIDREQRAVRQRTETNVERMFRAGTAQQSAASKLCGGTRWKTISHRDRCLRSVRHDAVDVASTAFGRFA